MHRVGDGVVAVVGSARRPAGDTTVDSLPCGYAPSRRPASGVIRTGSSVTGRFHGRRAIVTGASRGIGAAVARRLAADGADVALVARTVEPAEALPGSLLETARQVEAHGRRAVLVVADLSDEADRARVVPEAVEGLGGGVDVLVNNAAAAIYEPLLQMSTKRRRILFELNLHAPSDLARDAAPAMVDRGEGWIVNVSSGAARSWAGPPYELGHLGSTIATYGASKAALNRITNGLAAELHGTGVRVNAVAPRAAVLSEGADALVGDALGADQVEPMEAMVEAVVALCGCDPETTGLQAVSLDLLDDWGLEVRDLDGRVPGGSPPTAGPDPTTQDSSGPGSLGSGSLGPDQKDSLGPDHKEER